MKFKIILLALMLSMGVSSSLALESKETITENLVHLKNEIEEAARHGAKKFNELLTMTYDNLSDKIDELDTKLATEKKAAVIKFQKEREHIQKDIATYKQATKEEADAMRAAIIKKLEHLHQEIAAYNKKHGD